ncbi:MAG: NBR1-Ig-like domain-containing protein [Chloroflexota bacterium]
MIDNGTFTEGWRDLPPAPGNLINQEPAGWRLQWLEPGRPLYDDAASQAGGVPECVHKLGEQLPPNEQLGQPDALILAGDTTYKIFHASAPFGATLSQTVTGLKPGSEATLTVPVRVHRHGDPDIFGAESGVWVNGEGGWVHSGQMGDRRWHRHQVRFTVPENGQAEVVIRIKSKWPRPKDFFFDGITLEAVPARPGTEPSPPQEEPQPPAEDREPPAERMVRGWGWAASIERHDGLGRVNFPGGINLRSQPDQNAPSQGLVPAGTTVRITGAEQAQYYPVQVPASVLDARSEPGPAERYGYEFLTYVNSAGDYSDIQAGRQFTATWTVRNSGSEAWPATVRLVYVQAQRPETANDAPSPLGAAARYRLQEVADRAPVNPGETAAISLNLVAPRQPGWYASHWQLQTAEGEAIGRTLWLRIGVTGVSEPPAEPKPGARFRAGMNVNPDAHPPDVERLRGLDWVRYVYKASATHRNVDDAFQQQYRGLIQTYAAAGINSLLVINQETEWGNAPWHNGNWEAYAGTLARAARRIAELCAPFQNSVAYQIWNEEDSPPTNPSAIGVAPEDFAPVLAQTAQAIHQIAPGATVVIGGLNSGPDNAINYLRRIEARLGNSLPVDALAVHPYGRYVHNDPFYNRQFGTLQDALRKFREAYPNLPLWITELGVADNNPIGPEHYQKIASYMREIVAEVAENHADHVYALIWFAWSDLMRNAGITTVDGALKPHIGDAFRDMVARSRQTAPAFAQPPASHAGEVSLAKDVSFAAPQATAAVADSEFLGFSTTLQNHNAVPAGAAFTNKWHFRNTGGAIWGDGYRLVYVPQRGDVPQGGDAQPLMAQTSFALADVASPLPAAPGDEVVVTLNMTAPQQVGRFFRSRWELRDPQDNVFGHLYAEITTAPASTVGSGAQHADMAFVADHTVPDDTRFLAGESFLKQWRVRNTGARRWGNGFRLVFIEGDLQMARGEVSHMVPPADRGQEVVLSVPMVAPPARDKQPTTYQSLWRLQDDRGNFFGTPIWARIVSQATGNATPLGRFADPSGWYSQLDPRWRADILGHGQQDIGGWGCLLTCYAIMLTAFGLRVDPAELNRRLRQQGEDAFRGSDVQFAAPTLVLPGVEKMRHLRSWPTPELPFTEWTGEDPIARIDGALADGYVMLAQVDREPNNAFYHSNTEQHWVILLARTPAGDDYLILDPIIPADQIHTQPTSLMRKYGSAAPSRPHKENLRNAIKSALAYRFVGGAG